MILFGSMQVYLNAPVFSPTRENTGAF